MSRLAQPSKDFLWFLLRTHPSQTSQSAHSSFTECVLPGQVPLPTVPLQNSLLKLSTIVLDVSWCFWAESSSPNAVPYKNTQSVVLCCYVVRWLAGYQNVNCLLAVSQQKHITSWLTFKPDIMWSTAGSFVGSARAGCVYHESHIECQIGFSTLTHKERLEHWIHRIKDTKALDLLDGIDIYWCTSSLRSMMNNNISWYAQWSWSQETK